MQCEKTGAVAFSEEYGEWYYGDLYKISQPDERGMDVWVLKTVGETTREKFSQLRHITFHEINAKWLTLKPYGVIISCNATYHGYEGVSI